MKPHRRFVASILATARDESVALPWIRRGRR
ncbi:hypothetical protein SAMN05444007_10778 [Cribrihabitans marinus]|uniref:Uncharacterized protein n=1 Tax=Cribrihabitans marinus TaxID=1227549 RepID=A0A1H7BKA7_9RHOB|nr:hypothetical protein SAMN05444007_10778 [Cribrihabitans marinus]